MDEKEQRDFDARLYAPENRARPSQGVEQLWGMMGRPGVARGAAPAPAPAPAAPGRPRPASRVGGGE